MFRRNILLAFFALSCLFGYAQYQSEIDSLKQVLLHAKDDTSRVIIMAALGNNDDNKHDSAEKYCNEALSISKKINFKRGECLALVGLGNLKRLSGENPEGLELLTEALNIAEQNHFTRETADCLNSIGIVYSTLKDNTKAIVNYQSASKIYESLNMPERVARVEANLARAYRRSNRVDSAEFHIQKAIKFSGKTGSLSVQIWILMESAQIEFLKGNHQLAFQLLDSAIRENKVKKHFVDDAFAFTILAGFYNKSGKPDSCIFYAKKGFDKAQEIGFKFQALEAVNLLAMQYETVDEKQALYYHKIAEELTNELYGADKVQGLQKLLTEEQEQKRKSEIDRIAYQNRLRQYSFLAGITILLVVAFLLYRNNRQKHKANIVLGETLNDLTAAQNDLQNKNRELEIETALERVRAQSISMNKPADLPGICKVIYTELMALGFHEMRNAMINIHDDEKSTFINYDYSDTIGESINHLNYHIHPLIEKQIKQVRSADDAFSETAFTAQELEDWKIFRKNIGEKDDPGMENVDALHYYFYSIGTGSIGISTFNAITKEKQELLKRFRNVFAFAYRRYMDVSLAEAQAREAQVELALERIRARTMAMQRSDELAETAYLVFEQFRELGEAPDQITIGTIDEAARTIQFWITMQGKKMDRSITASIDEPTLMHKLFIAWREQKKSAVIDLSGKELEAYIIYRNSLSNAINNPGNIVSDERRIIHAAFFSKGFITFSTPDARPVESLRLLERFTGVFDLTYTRFLDLQQAEAQLREAKIEAALERVRSRSMGMHVTEEMQDVVDTLFQSLKELEIKVDTANILIDTPGADYFEGWTATTPYNSNVTRSFIAISSAPHLAEVKDAIMNGRDLVTGVYDFEEKNKWFNFLFTQTEFKNVENARKQFVLNAEALSYTVTISKNIGIHLNNYSAYTSTEDEINTIKKFTRVFEQSYTRFLDLQKAEAQARESLIELGLERVRARAMAMQKSNELKALIGTMFTELTKLDLVLTRCIILIFEPGSNDSTWWMANSETPSEPIGLYVKYHAYPAYDANVKAWQERTIKYQYILQGTIKKDWDEYLFSETEFSLLPDIVIAGMRAPEKVYLSASCNNFGSLNATSLEPLSDEHFDILLRFAKVFDLTYTRFNDLQKAEAQARESQIQLALERVRAKTMAMQHSDELRQAANLLFQQVKALGLSVLTCGYNIWEKEEKICTAWMSSEDGLMLPSFRIPLTENEIFIRFYDSRLQGESFYVIELSGEALAAHYRYMLTLPGFGEIIDGFLNSGFTLPDLQINHISNFSHGNLIFVTYRHVPDAWDIFKRFTAVFEQTYTRFLDLQKAEAQTRESLIELGLERVRARAMAMHKTEELFDTAETLYKELSKLGIESSSCGFALVDEATKIVSFYAVSPADGKIMKYPNLVPLTETKVMQSIWEGWKNQETSHLIQLDEGETIEHETYIAKYSQLSLKENGIDNGFTIEDWLASSPKKVKLHSFYFQQGYLLIVSGERLSTEEEEMMVRFTKVFQLTYRRFLDLKQAETQAREAQVELSLERVRSKTMAMHNSKDVADAVALMFDELIHLGIDKKARCGIGILSNDMKMEVWTAFAKVNGKVELDIGELDMTSHQMLGGVYESWKNNAKHSTYRLAGEDIKNYYRAINSMKEYPAKFDIATLPQVQFQNAFYFKEGIIYIFSLQQLTAGEIHILKRFADAFGLTYRRFLDLQKAETQAREANIEAALERVRSRSMAMQKSDELTDVATILSREVKGFGGNVWTTGFGIWEGENFINCFISNSDGNIRPAFKIHHTEDPSMQRWYAAKDNNMGLMVQEIGGKELADHYRYIMTTSELNEISNKNELSFPDFQINHCAYFSYGYLLFITHDPCPQLWDIFKRFAKVFEQVYTRFLDLQKSEASAKNAIQKASIDRVRAEIASMRTTADLEKITPLIWNELTALGIRFIRCGIFIMNETEQIVQTFLSTPDGHAIASFNIPYHAAGNIDQVIAHWRQKKIYTDEWMEKDFIDFAGQLVKQGAVATSNPYLSSTPHGTVYLHFIPFLQGMVYVGNTSRLLDEEISLLESLAEAFSTAYARYEDFNRIETAKKVIENAMKDLKDTQAQLVQSEKMASLGELTAGIAHEIQNPLNFVNNFSEVSRELIDEMNDELEKGDIEEAKFIAADIRQNLEKINHHGKRADSIVKGMLEHSRTSSGTKELIDVNKLTDEFLRLSYHGLRAKDKSFSAEIITSFDESIEKINMIGQDMGRVILNLVNNAFYAVNEKSKQNIVGYKPVVTVTTRKFSNEVLISVADNGNGIPQKIIDKIFQPFFTTKPTGQGTGLGLSLSYDIIKAHGGEINVESPINGLAGTSIIVRLPVN